MTTDAQSYSKQEVLPEKASIKAQIETAPLSSQDSEHEISTNNSFTPFTSPISYDSKHLGFTNNIQQPTSPEIEIKMEYGQAISPSSVNLANCSQQTEQSNQESPPTKVSWRSPFDSSIHQLKQPSELSSEYTYPITDLNRNLSTFSLENSRAKSENYSADDPLNNNTTTSAINNKSLDPKEPSSNFNLPAENLSPQKSPSRPDKGKSKLLFFTNTIFKNSSKPNINASTDGLTARSPINSKYMAKSDSLESQDVSKPLDEIDNQNDFKLHKSRSKSDVGVYGHIDMRQSLRQRLIRRGSNHSDTEDCSKDTIDPDLHHQENLSDSEIDRIHNEEESRQASRRRLNFIQRHINTPTFGSIASGNSVKNNEETPNEANSNHPETPNLDPHPGFLRRHTIFSMEYSPPSIPLEWKDVKNKLKRFKKKKTEKQGDGSASNSGILSELIAIIPAAMIVPMAFLKDDRNIHTIPVLLHHIDFKFIDITRNQNEKNRKYSIELSYGSGSARLQWVIIRDYRDFMGLHSRLRVASFQNVFGPKLLLPKFPSRHYVAEHMNKDETQANCRNLGVLSPTHSIKSIKSNKSQLTAPHMASGPSSHATSTSRPPPVLNVLVDPKPQLSTIMDEDPPPLNLEPTSSSFSLGSDVSAHSYKLFRRVQSLNGGRHLPIGSIQFSDSMREKFHESLRLALEKYLHDLFKAMRFRPEANRLFQFLELSNMSMRLAPENSYHGKEGYLILRSSAGSMGWRVSHWKPNELSQMIDRHTSRWYLVRESYIVCVNDISSANVTEVFMVDPNFKITHGYVGGCPDDDTNEKRHSKASNESKGESKHQGFTFEVENSERKMKLLTTSQRQLGLWLESINHMKDHTIWSKPHRFNSFAPVRTKVQARWFVDARDYFWTVSSAIDMAKDVIYIHDWWLSPELYLRRPPDGNQEWRIDRLLKRKAEQGVKIFIIIYRNVGQTVPIDSSWTKHSFLDLHPNIYIMRSPNQLLQNTFFWAHHEKLCLIDHIIGFLGGIDLCFGRWDTPSHVLVDDDPNAFYDPNSTNNLQKDGQTQIWPGKDYSNPRQHDFFSLDKPYEDMYDRNEVPRMPWHDIHMMVTGQSARDITRHFVQRWNYLIRQKRPSRFTPLLLPPADLTQEDLEELNLEGTCEVQILRSSCNWSLGIKKPESSIQNAYLKAIEQSEHFVYIENQFFISSTFYEGTEIENRIGDSLYERIVRAHRNNENWKCVVVIPLMPGFESEIDEKNGLSVRMIMQLQYLTISHGSESIFGKLFKKNINPEDYIQFFSLRQWGKIGPKKRLVTEQLYIHSKTMIVDDRIAIIGSANINERSMRGNRDSEVAALIRDTAQIQSSMGGKPYMVGKFPHTLRVRLMREHVGIDIDQLEMVESLVDQELASRTNYKYKADFDYLAWMQSVQEMSQNPGNADDTPTNKADFHSFNNLAGVDNIGFRDKKPLSSDSRVQGNETHKLDVDGIGPDKYRKREAMDVMGVPSNAPKDAISLKNLALQYFEQLWEDLGPDGMVRDVDDIKRQVYYYLQTKSWRRPDGNFDNIGSTANGNKVPVQFFPNQSQADDNIFQFRDMKGSNASFGMSSSPAGFNGSASVRSDAHGSSATNLPNGSSATNLNNPDSNGLPTSSSDRDLPNQYFYPIDPFGFSDPLSDEFYYDLWERVADQNTLLYREVFHCQPDDEVTTWKQYIEFKELASRFARQQGQKIFDDVELDMPDEERQQLDRAVENFTNGGVETKHEKCPPGHCEPNPADGQSSSCFSGEGEEEELSPERMEELEKEAARRAAAQEEARILRENYKAMLRRRRQNRRSTRNILNTEEVYSKNVAERVMQGVRGNLVFFPTQWLAHELDSGNWQHAIDHLPPIEIYD